MRFRCPASPKAMSAIVLFSEPGSVPQQHSSRSTRISLIERLTLGRGFSILPASLQPMIIMSRLLKNRCWWIVAFVLCAKVCFGQAPSGDFDFTFDPSLDPIINMSGTFQSDQTIIGAGGTETPITISVDITNAVSGGLKGSGFGIVQVGNDVLGAAYTASGRVSGGGGAPTRVVLSV